MKRAPEAIRTMALDAVIEMIHDAVDGELGTFVTLSPDDDDSAETGGVEEEVRNEIKTTIVKLLRKERAKFVNCF